MNAVEAAGTDIGRNYRDARDADYPRVTLEPADALPWTAWPTKVRVETEKGSIERVIFHPHLAMLKLLKDYQFTSVLDIGCGEGREVEIFRHVASRVAGINADPNPTFAADFHGDYLDYQVNEPFDAIWCSHVLEHIRNPGTFLEKVFRDLNEDGVLALSVPYHDFSAGWDVMILGHHTRYNVPLLIYQLVAAGFDCRQLAFRVYCGQISVILRKGRNGLPMQTMAPFAKEVFDWFPAEVLTKDGIAHITADRLNWT
jgi:SAM-dependent methyltransferase